MFEKQVATSFAAVRWSWRLPALARTRRAHANVPGTRRQVSEILERVLGTYFEGIDTKSLHVSVFSGTVVLDNLRMRPSAFSALGLPLAVKHGRVRHVELELSLRNLRGTPARMHIDGIEIVVDPDTAKGAEADDLQTLTGRKRALQKDRDDRRQALLAPKDGSNVCMYIYTYIRMYVCMYVYTYVCIYICMYLCKYVCMHICIHVVCIRSQSRRGW